MCAQLKAAVIGVGAMGQHHARIYDQMAGISLVGVADVSLESGARAARLYHTLAFSDYAELLSDTCPDIVSVAVPTELHCQVTLDILKTGSHVLVEKPITTSEQEAQKMIKSADEEGLKLMVGHVERFNPALCEMRKRLEAGELGRIFQVRCRRFGPFPSHVLGVGVVVDLATHDLDLMRFLTGQEVIRVYAETERKIHTTHEDMLAGTVRLTDGVIGILDINWLTPTKVRELAVTGERGMLCVHCLTQDLFFYENAEADSDHWDAIGLLRGVSGGRMIRYPVSKREPLRAELEAFVQSVICGRPVPVSGEDGLKALNLALALVKSGRERRCIEVAR